MAGITHPPQMQSMYEEAKTFLHSICTGNYEGGIACTNAGVYIDMDLVDIMSEGDQTTPQHVELDDSHLITYRSYVLGAEQSAVGLLACASVSGNTAILEYVLSLNPEIPGDGDRLFILEHASYTSFTLICQKYGRCMTDDVINHEVAVTPSVPYRAFIRKYSERPRETMLDSLAKVGDEDMVFFSKYYTDRPAVALLGVFRMVGDLDSYYERKFALLDRQLRKFGYLITHSARGSIAKVGMLEKIVRLEFHSAVEKLLDWGVLSCDSDASDECILYCIKQLRSMTLISLLSDVNFAYARCSTAHLEIVKPTWSGWRGPAVGARITCILATCNFTYVGCVYDITMRDSSDRLTALYKAGALIRDTKNLVHADRSRMVFDVIYDVEAVVSVIENSRKPRSLQECARLCVKQQVGPCRFGMINTKMMVLPLPASLISELCEI
jgi:hypothetical protein